MEAREVSGFMVVGFIAAVFLALLNLLNTCALHECRQTVTAFQESGCSLDAGP